MDIMLGGFDQPMFVALQQLMDIPDETEKTFNAPSRAYVRDRKAMRNTPADVKDLPGAIVYIVDMPGVKGRDIKVQVEDGNILVVSGERKRPADEEKEKDAKYLRMERRMGKFMRKFPLPENANTDAITATYQDGELTVIVEKLLPPGQENQDHRGQSCMNGLLRG